MMKDELNVLEPVRQVGLLQLKCMAKNYIVSCKKHVDETSFFHERGLTDETIHRFGLGYDPAPHCAVIPFSGSYYVTRNVNIGADQKGPCKHHKPKGLRQPLFNMGNLSDHPERVVFIAKAPLDAISIVQCGGNAIALGGYFTAALGKVLDTYRPQCHFVLALDYDAPGQRAQETVRGVIENRGLSCSCPLHPIFTQYKDANAILMNEPNALVDAVKQEREHLASKLEREMR